MKKTIKNLGVNGFNGYQEWYLDNRETKLWYRCIMYQNRMMQYAEYHRIKQCYYHVR
jgi:mannose/cellobiose epimerase-like protein (N-acyl-D-glucosamine 2-epimerase family)